MPDLAAAGPARSRPASARVGRAFLPDADPHPPDRIRPDRYGVGQDGPTDLINRQIPAHPAKIGKDFPKTRIIAPKVSYNILVKLQEFFRSCEAARHLKKPDPEAGTNQMSTATAAAEPSATANATGKATSASATASKTASATAAKTTSAARIEANRRNAQKSTGPRSQAGKDRSRFNALQHGLRATLPVLPGEDESILKNRLDSWTVSLEPRDEVERYLVERAVNVSIQLDRADRAWAARLDAERIAGRSGSTNAQADEVVRLGRRLFWDPRGPIALYPFFDPMIGDPPRCSWMPEIDDPLDPPRLVGQLESSALGCAWLLDRWRELRELLEDDLAWQAPDRFRAIRLLGRQPLHAPEDDRVLTIYLASHAIDPTPEWPTKPDAAIDSPFADALIELDAGERVRFLGRIAGRLPRFPATMDAAAGRTCLIELVTEQENRLEEILAAHIERETAAEAMRGNFDETDLGERLRRHQVWCNRTILRILEILRRRHREADRAASGEARNEGRKASGKAASPATTSPAGPDPSSPAAPCPRPPRFANPTNEPNGRRAGIPTNEPNGRVPGISTNEPNGRVPGISTNEPNGRVPGISTNEPNPPAPAASRPAGPSLPVAPRPSSPVRPTRPFPTNEPNADGARITTNEPNANTDANTDTNANADNEGISRSRLGAIVRRLTLSLAVVIALIASSGAGRREPRFGPAPVERGRPREGRIEPGRTAEDVLGSGSPTRAAPPGKIRTQKGQSGHFSLVNPYEGRSGSQADSGPKPIGLSSPPPIRIRPIRTARTEPHHTGRTQRPVLEGHSAEDTARTTDHGETDAPDST